MVNGKQATVAGSVTFAIAGITATMTAADAAEWLKLLAQYAPLVLCGWLLYVLFNLERQHDTCRQELIGVHRELGDIRAKVAALEARASDE